MSEDRTFLSFIDHDDMSGYRVTVEDDSIMLTVFQPPVSIARWLTADDARQLSKALHQAANP